MNGVTDPQSLPVEQTRPINRARVLVVGTYPPIPLPAAQATVAAVKAAWATGHQVTVVSPRLSAADYAVPVTGPLAGTRLDRIRRRVAADQLVLVVEEGFPLLDGPAAVQWATALGLARAMRRFDEVTLVIVGQLGRSGRALAPIRAAATRITNAPAGPVPAGVTPTGPAETTGREVPAELVSKVARRVLGRHTPAVRSRLGSLRRRWRAAAGRVR